MQIFISSSTISFDKELNIISLDIDNLDMVEQNDIVIGSGTFRDELIIKSLINRGCLPFFVTLDRDGKTSPIFKNLTFILSSDSYFLRSETIEEIIETQKIIYGIEEQYNKQEELEESLKELLLNNQYLLNSFILKSGQKSAGVKVVDKAFQKLYIYIREGKKRKTIYVILQEDNLLKLFSQEVDKSLKIKDKLIKNRFRAKFKKLMESHQEEFTFGDNQFENITLKYKKEFLLVDEERRTLLDVELMDFVLHLYSDLDIEKIAIYRLYNHSQDIDKKRKELLKSMHQQLNKKGYIKNIELLLAGRGLYEVGRDREKRANIVSDIYIKFLEKISREKEKKRITNFDFATISLQGDFESLDEHILTNIFYHISDGIGISSIVKKEFSNFLHNFESSQDIVEEAEEALEFDECYYELDEFLDTYSLNQRVLNIDHIDRLKSCLGDTHKLSNKLKRLYSQLSYQEVGNYNIEQINYDENIEENIVKKNYYENFVTVMLNSLFNMRGFDGVKLKGLALFMSYVGYQLSIEDKDKSIDCCFFTFFNLYSDREPENFLLALSKYFENREDSIMDFFKKRESYHCSGDKISVILSTLNYKDKSAKCTKFRKQKSRKFEPDLLKVGEFYQLISGQKKMDMVIKHFIDKIVNKELDSADYCQGEEVLEFLNLFFEGKKRCSERLAYFFECFKDELK